MRQLLLGFFLVAVLVGGGLAQDAGDYTVNLGMNFSDQARKQPTFLNKETVPSKVEYWLRSDLSLRVQSTLLISRESLPKMRNTGRGDAILGATYTLFDYDNDHPFGFSLDYQIKFPTAIKGLGSDQTDHQVTGTLYRTFSKGRLYTEFDGGAYIAGQQGRSDISTAQFSLVEIVGLGKAPAKGKAYKWKLLNETDYSPAAAGSPTSIVQINQIIRVFSPVWSIRFGPNYAITPYDSRFGFAAGIQYKGHFGK